MPRAATQMAVAFGGDAKERTPKQWRRLLAATAFELAEVHPTRSLVHFVEARPGRAASKWARGDPLHGNAQMHKKPDAAAQ